MHALPTVPVPRARSRGGDRERIFTAYVRSLTPGAEPDRDALVRVLRTLAGMLRKELKRRGQWLAPPSYLGVYGWASWDEPGALEDLTSACYAYTFVTRLRALRAQLRVKPNIDGLVFRNVRNFVHDRQRRHDPLGYRAWEVVRAAVETALADGALHLLSDGPAVDDDTLLAVRPGADPRQPDPDEASRRRQAIRALVAQWTGDLLPDLVTARGRQRDGVAAELAVRLPALAGEGVEVFRFRDLLGPLRAHLRETWAAMLWHAKGDLTPLDDVETGPQAAGGGEDDGEDVGFVRVLRLYRPPPAPDRRAAERQSARRLTDCVSSAVEEAELDRRTHGYLETLWSFLRTCVSDDELVPSQRRMSATLGIPRDRFRELLDQLGEMLHRCRRLLGIGGKGES